MIKPRILGLIALGLIALFALKSFSAYTISGRDAEGSVSFESSEYELGILSPLKPVEVSLQIRNKSNHPVIITKIEPSCSCTTISSTASTILPDGTAKVLATVETSGKRGAFSVKIIVEYKDVRQMFLTTHVMGWVEPASGFLVTPERIELTDKTSADLTVTAPAEVIRTLKCRSLDKELEAKVESIKDVDSHIGIEQETVLLSNKINSHFSKDTSLIFISALGSVVVPVRWAPLEQFSFIPAKIFLGIIKPNAIADGSFLLKRDAKIISVPPDMVISKTKETDGFYDKYDLEIHNYFRRDSIISMPIAIKDADQEKKLWITWCSRSPNL
jgi:hypothetical protein